MFELKDYRAVESLDQAEELLLKDKKNVILGGLLWMKMGKNRYNTGIDLCRLGLDRIIDKGDTIELGCMTSLRELETSHLLTENFGSLFKDALGHIVGVQFRNLATLGGSVAARFSFSDLITALMVLDTRVHFHRAGTVSLADFLTGPSLRDILVKISIPKVKIQTKYLSHRLSATDFPVLAAALSRKNDQWTIALGARPSRAKLAPKAAGMLSKTPDPGQVRAACDILVEELGFGSNQRGTMAFREKLARVLVKRGIDSICR